MTPELLESVLQRLENLERCQGNLIRVGRVEEIDEKTAKVRVRLGETLVTPLLPYFERAAGDVQTYALPSVGEGVIVINTAGGESLASGLVLRGVNTSDKPSLNSGKGIARINMPDGAFAEYDHKSSALNLSLSGEAVVNIKGDVSLTVGGSLKAKVEGEAEIDALMISMNGGGGGLITSQSICAFTGAPHQNASTTVKASL